MDKKYTYIYALSDPITKHIRYIGKADNPCNRYKSHVFYPKHLKSKKTSWIKSLSNKGEVPEIEIIDVVSFSEWKFWEMHYISLYKSWGFKLTNGTFGGEGGVLCEPYKWTDKQREKIRQRQLNMPKEYWDKIRVANTGKKKNLEQLKRLSDAHKNQTNSNLRKSIIQLDLNGNLIKEFVSVSEAARIVCGAVGRNSNILKAMKRKNGTYKGYRWAYNQQEISAIGQ